MTADEFRRLALSLPEAVEGEHMGHPDFRIGGRVFASLRSPDDRWGMVKLTPDQQRTFMEHSPGVFTPSAGAWGRQGYTLVLLKDAAPEVVRSALALAPANHSPARKKGASGTRNRTSTRSKV